jgi:hypothetical protein
MAVHMRAGKVCKDCSPGKCLNRPTPNEPLCIKLEGHREIDICECPNDWIGEPVRRLVLDAERIRDGGHLPVAGGYYEQPAAFISGIELVYAEQAALNRESKNG